MAICCPVTNTDRGVPFHVSITARTSLTGFVMCEQLKSLDFKSRRIKLIERAPADLLEDVMAIIDASIFCICAPDYAISAKGARALTSMPPLLICAR